MSKISTHGVRHISTHGPAGVGAKRDGDVWYLNPSEVIPIGIRFGHERRVLRLRGLHGYAAIPRKGGGGLTNMRDAGNFGERRNTCLC